MDKMKFNVDKNTGKEIVADEFDEDLEEDEQDDSSSDNNGGLSNEQRRAKLIKLLFTVIIGIVGVILVITLLTSITGGKKSYEDIENIMASAAESYFKDHPESLPKKDGGTQIVEVSVLVAEGKMKELTKYTDSACNGSVKVQKTGTKYVYIPKLDCGDAYSSEPLYKEIRNDNKIVNTGYGLYNKNGNYVFRGEKVKNYVKLDSALWRIVKITSANEIVLVMAEPLSSPVPWDDRYNQDVDYASGINNYSSSRLKEKLNELYETTSEDVTNILLSDKDKSKIVSHNVCSGKRGLTQTGVEQAVECKEVLRDQKLSLLTAADFMNASVDPNCTNASSPTCQNYNYLINENSWWLLTAISSSNSEVYMVESNRGMVPKKCNMYARLRPVVYLNSEVMYKSGSGTEEDPYIIK